MPITLDGRTGITTPIIVTLAVELDPVTLVTPVAGELEYDGKVPYITPQDLQRGVVPGMQYYRLNSGLAGANATGAQSVFGVGTTLSSSTVYAFEASYQISKSTGTTTHAFGIGFGGTATLNNIAYQLLGQYNGTSFTTTTTAIATMLPWFIQTASNTVLITGGASAPAFYMLTVRGTVSVNAGGTFIPQYSLSVAPGGAYTTAIGSYFLIYPIGAAGSNTNVGDWA